MEPVGLSYGKHKLFGWRQCMKNQLTDKIFNYLYPSNCVNNNIYNNFSFSRQIPEVIGDQVLNLMNGNVKYRVYSPCQFKCQFKKI